ncbi:hypothetical protein NY547_08970 [Cnuibacter physcomitrellae]|uniref:hypothetical protein n=1 Tax=Cnuibacter physcomitrellae TaxID=1619308 RepID=UPI002175E066|nr:hypothetical protein [Cnuibacter physcomitrellae]MCS5497365.1 hypothetical protein [Cnuibacter physcomitrellae]
MTITWPRTSPVRRHLRWVIPLVVGVVGVAVLFFFAAQTAEEINSYAPGSSPTSLAGRLVLLLMGLIALGVACAVVTLVNGSRTLAEWLRTRRRAAGRYTPDEQARLDEAARLRDSWAAASQLRADLIARKVPPQVTVWDLAPYADEVFFVDAPVQYSRYYGTDVTYTQTSGFYYGRPSFVLAGVAASAIGNASRRSAASAQAREQWREHQSVRMLVSNKRIATRLANGQWLSFDFAAMSAVYPEPRDWTLICQFPSTSPLLLTGPAVPAASLLTLLMTHGPHAVAEHPSLEPLSLEAPA